MSALAARVDHGVTAGTFSLDGETFEVENNIWVLGDDDECVVIDAPHSVSGILTLIGRRVVRAIVCTHAHDDHVRAAPALREAVNHGSGAPILLHPADQPLWDMTHPADSWDADLVDGQILGVGGVTLEVLHTPGHAPGAVCLYSAELECVFTGDTLFQGGPGATGRSFSSAAVLDESIHTKLFALPDNTLVHTGHGASTTIGEERRLARARDESALA